MILRLPTAPSVRSLPVRPGQRRLTSTKPFDPLRILFCGSDGFSIASLRALYDAKQANQNFIESIEVAHRPGKRTGRGLKVIRQVPIQKVAKKELALQTHEIDTFTGWTPPTPFDIIIAVSFGLLVPPRILNGTKYGGLNVHPSLLPDLRGPAPIHHTLLKRRSKAGVTIQTLHPEHFDQGLILAQTPPPGIDVPEGATPTDLIEQLGLLGGEMLVRVLENGDFVPPLKEAGWYAGSGGPIDHAEKITPAHRHIDFSTATAQDILTRHRVLGNLWSMLPGKEERFIINEIEAFDIESDANDITSALEEGASANTTPGVFVALSPTSHALCARTADGKILRIKSTTCPGGMKGRGNSHIIGVLLQQQMVPESVSKLEIPFGQFGQLRQRQ
ncbi:methionyl-tRNA formyltransferase [Westerdykella ornata]|uniref:methionyl-tRNA formyltransferase n=1 Tax=Westerdykella ornata TaxID=318751 RepID=A0A6A6JVF3_WESOR|nr:methionyl-tRNA formyltransferase [Westerdykella ornata]KAF2280580.1 methionyl-tRNA formyltransferase [Westerdykella ornata]